MQQIRGRNGAYPTAAAHSLRIKSVRDTSYFVSTKLARMAWKLGTTWPMLPMRPAGTLLYLLKREEEPCGMSACHFRPLTRVSPHVSSTDRRKSSRG